MTEIEINKIIQRNVEGIVGEILFPITKKLDSIREDFEKQVKKIEKQIKSHNLNMVYLNKKMDFISADITKITIENVENRAHSKKVIESANEIEKTGRDLVSQTKKIINNKVAELLVDKKEEIFTFFIENESKLINKISDIEHAMKICMDAEMNRQKRAFENHCHHYLSAVEKKALAINNDNQ